jgi:hypothetical protein
MFLYTDIKFHFYDTESYTAVLVTVQTFTVAVCNLVVTCYTVDRIWMLSLS